MDDLRVALGVGARTVVVLAAALAAVLLSGAVEPVDLVTPGGRGPSAAPLRADFGAEQVPAERTGYDGQQFYAIARQFPDLDAASESLDAPRYRLLRIVAPAIALIGGEGTPVVLILLALNVLGTGLACGALAVLCRERGWSPALGYLAAVPVVFGIIGSTADPLSLRPGPRRAGPGPPGAAPPRRGRARGGRPHAGAGGGGRAGGRRRSVGERGALAGAGPLRAAGGRGAGLVRGPRRAGGWHPPRSARRPGRGPHRLLLSLYGAWAGRGVAVVWPVALGFGLWILLYYAGTFDLQALPRTTAPSLAFGLAAVGARLRPARPAA